MGGPRRIRFGTLGAAAITPAALIRPAKLVPEVTVVAVAARARDRAEAFARKHGIDRVHTSYEELIADPEIDAVYVPLPNSLHGRWTRRAVAAGKHVLCEKPFTANAEEAVLVAAEVARTDRVVMEAFHWRYHPMAARIVELIQGGELGQLRHVEASVCFPLVKPGDIRYRLDLAGGALMDAGCYAVHMVRTAVGEEPEVVDAEMRLTKGGVDRCAEARLRFPGGATGLVRTSLFSRHLLSVKLRVVGSRGEMRVRNPLMPKLLGSIRLEVNGVSRLERGAHSSTYTHQMQAFAAAVLDGGAYPTTPEDAIRNMATIDSIYRAAGLEPRSPGPAPL
ncbi:MAG: Gfo/Idh/MocA family protein [Acidimicrobiales bacterium]